MGKTKVVRPRKQLAVRDKSLIGSLLTDAAEDTGWRPPEVLPRLGDYKRLGYDLETDGTDIWGKSRITGYVISAPDGNSWYLPIRHRGGGNLDENMVRYYLQRELRGKQLVTAEGKFEVHMSYKEGIDLEAQGNEIREVQYKAALLDDQRRSFKLDDLAQDFIQKKKVDLDRALIWQMPSHMVGPYAEEDGRLTLEVDDYLTPRIEAEGLTRVAKLEDDLTYCTCEMERNGVPLDIEKLDRWHKEIRSGYTAAVARVAKETGLRINPNSPPDLKKLFDYLGLSYGFTEKGAASFTDSFLATVDHPIVKDFRRLRALDSLDGKYLSAYKKRLGPDNILRYKLHQMKADSESGSGMYGTISGRYSSSSINIQQVFDKKRQLKKLGTADYVIRELFLPRPGRLWVKADAKQIEYRLFAHYANSEKLNRMYRENPEIDFHEIVQEMIRPYREIDRQDAKGTNFAKLYGSGVYKLAKVLGVSLEVAQAIIDAYDAAIPEAKTLMKTAMERVKKVGYVRTLLNRRARFKKVQVPSKYNPDQLVWEYDRIYSALNRAIQGSAADVMKLKLKEVYDNRKLLDFFMFFTVHDDVDGDTGSEKGVKLLKELLDEPIAELKLRVPILWDVKSGKNWAEAG